MKMDFNQILMMGEHYTITKYIIRKKRKIIIEKRGKFRFTTMIKYFYNYLSVFVAISSFSIFMFFYKVKIQTNWLDVVVDKITPNVFFIYFIHNAVLLILIDWLSKLILIQNHLLIMLPGIAVITFCISFILAEIHRAVALKLRRVFNLKGVS